MTHLFVKGLNGQVEVDDEWVRIHRGGLMGHTTQGVRGLIGRGIQIPLADIVDIEISYPRMTVRGYIRFCTSVEPAIGPIEAIHDEASVLFMKRHQEDMQQLRSDVLTLIGLRGPAPSTPAPSAVGGFATQLRELGALRDEGLLTEEEFQAKKEQLLHDR